MVAVLISWISFGSTPLNVRPGEPEPPEISPAGQVLCTAEGEEGR